MNFDTTHWLHNLWGTGSKYFLFAGIAFFVFYILFRRVFHRIRIQNEFPKSRDYFRDIFYSLISILIFGSVSYFVFFTLRPYNNIQYGTVEEYGVVYFWLSFIWMFFLHDTYFYWMHRFMHLPLFFRHIHRVHHQSTNPSPWTAYAFHPLEAILEAGIIPLIAFTVPVNRIAFTTFMIFQIVYNVYGHLGYEIMPAFLQRTKAGQWINSSTTHNKHHKYFKGNYGLYTLIWDKVLKTERRE
jgi:Delta7-sterol 5-desaturase